MVLKWKKKNHSFLLNLSSVCCALRPRLSRQDLLLTSYNIVSVWKSPFIALVSRIRALHYCAPRNNDCSLSLSSMLLTYSVLLASPPHYATVADNHSRPMRRGWKWRRYAHARQWRRRPLWCSCVCVTCVWWRLWFRLLLPLTHASGYDVSACGSCFPVGMLRENNRRKQFCPWHRDWPSVTAECKLRR